MMMKKISAVLLILAISGWMSYVLARDMPRTNQPGVNFSLLQERAGVLHAETQQTLRPECAPVAERARQQAEEIVPGRTWTWALDAERSLQQLDRLRQDLIAVRHCEAAFEATLAATQLAMYATQVRAMTQLTQHLERDVQSLDDELRKGHPRRWHVARDAQDMQKEIQHWKTLHETVWSGSLRAKAGSEPKAEIHLQ
jgi:hypothetical protein